MASDPKYYDARTERETPLESAVTAVSKERWAKMAQVHVDVLRPDPPEEVRSVRRNAVVHVRRGLHAQLKSWCEGRGLKIADVVEQLIKDRLRWEDLQDHARRATAKKDFA